MFIIFGWPERKANRKSITLNCGNCQRDTIHEACSKQRWFTLFFIPIFPVSAKVQRATCNVCGQAVILDKNNPSLVSLPSNVSCRCPDCAEPIHYKAHVCKHCGYRLTEAEQAAIKDEFTVNTEFIHQETRQRDLLRKARIRSWIAWPLIVIAAIFIMAIISSLVNKRGLDKAEPGGIIFGILITVVLPFFIGIRLLRTAKKQKAEAKAIKTK